MEITKQIVHPNFPSFVTTIKYLGRLASLKRMAFVETGKKPYVVLDPTTQKPFIYTEGPSKGEPMVVWKADIAGDFAVQTLREFVTGFEGLELHGEKVPFGDANLETLFDPALDVPFEIEVEEDGAKVKKTGTIAWAKMLERKATDRATFDADPQQPASAKQ